MQIFIFDQCLMMLSLSVSVKKYLFVIDSSEYEFDVGTYINIYYPLQVYCRHNNHALCKTLLTHLPSFLITLTRSRPKSSQCNVDTLRLIFQLCISTFPAGGLQVILAGQRCRTRKKNKNKLSVNLFPRYLIFLIQDTARASLSFSSFPSLDIKYFFPNCPLWVEEKQTVTGGRYEGRALLLLFTSLQIEKITSTRCKKSK